MKGPCLELGTLEAEEDSVVGEPDEEPDFEFLRALDRNRHDVSYFFKVPGEFGCNLGETTFGGFFVWTCSHSHLKS